MIKNHPPLMLAASAALTVAMLALAACGGGGDAGSEPSGTSTAASAPSTGPTLAQRIAAATATAQNDANPCGPIRPFYWEIGDRTGERAAGSVNATSNATVYTADTIMSIASASKWLYGAYVVQRRANAGTAPSDEDVKFLSFRSGYSNFSSCAPGQTVDSCLATGSNGAYSRGTDGYFFYNGGHMQEHAHLIGLGALDSAGLAAELRGTLGSDILFTYSQPQPAGGVVTNAANYARFLRKLLDGSLALGAQLGSHAVCDNPVTCPSEALSTPIPTSETWHYSLGHWVEDDPVVGDGAFSSAGAFGFYPWIDAGKRWYGVLARRDDQASGYASAQCGRLIRKAWITGTAQ